MSNNTPSRLLDLPEELLIGVLDHLPPLHLLRFREVCKSTLDLVDGHVPWQYSIALWVAGQQDGPPSHVLPVERLARLREHQDAWMTLDWKSQFTFPEDKQHCWDMYGNIFAMGDSQHLTFIQLPSEIRGIAHAQWDVEVDINFQDFAIDPSQDLLVLLETIQLPDDTFISSVHFRSVTTGLAHPLAGVSPIELPHIAYLSQQWEYNIRISANYVGVLYTQGWLDDQRGENHFYIWNWRSGLDCLSLKLNTLVAFAFLTENCVLLGVLPSGRDVGPDSLDPSRTYDPPRLEVLRFPDGTNNHTNTGYTCVFEYPGLAPGTWPRPFSFRTNPAPGWAPPPSQKIPFHVAPRERLLIVELTFTTEWGTPTTTHFIHLPVIENFTARASSTQNEEGARPPSIIPWKDWGPLGSRFASVRWNPDLDGQVFGSRFCTLDYLQMKWRNANVAWRVELWDFNQRALRFGLAQKEKNRNASAKGVLDEFVYVIRPKKYEVSFIFADPEKVVTELPYRFKTIVLPQSIASIEQREMVVMTEDSIIIIGPDGQGGIRWNICLNF